MTDLERIALADSNDPVSLGQFRDYLVSVLSDGKEHPPESDATPAEVAGGAIGALELLLALALRIDPLMSGDTCSQEIRVRGEETTRVICDIETLPGESYFALLARLIEALAQHRRDKCKEDRANAHPAGA